jgi:hypothetical protein
MTKNQERPESIKYFEFKQCVSIPKFTGKKAGKLIELKEIIATVSDESLFHHTYQYFLKGHILEYTNDFAHWAGESLEESALAEHFSNIDPYNFISINDLRKELLRVIDDYLEGFPEPREAISGDEFYFNETITLTLPVGIRVHNLAQFLIGIKYVDAGSIYYHFYEARMRLGGGIDDFSAWVDGVLGKKELSDSIRGIDPFMHSIDGIREHIVEAVEAEVKRDMEVIQQ